jgi:subtilisin family serine protease
MGMYRRRTVTAAIAALVLAATFGQVPAVASPVPAGHPVDRRAAAAAPGAAGAAAMVTLITGDRVRLVAQDSSETAVGIEPAPGREHVGFLRSTRTGRHGTEVSVVPADAVRLLGEGRLDPRLFDVTGLVRQGFTDADRPTLPLIITYSGAAAAARTVALAPVGAAATVRVLPSINGAAVQQDKRRGAEFWNWLAGTRGARAAAPRALGAGVRKVWLDAVSQPALDVSVPQIGAPAAWQAGLTGAGVTVGVLDTGVKADHPDLAGKIVEARDFTDTQPDARDDVGHGTHVAGIIAGTGAASGGRYRGVAPDTKLISGKVCVIWGCPDSAIIAGMEWIAPKVRVVNMSIGGGATDGTDPVSQAVNSLTAQHGTLFVIAAGNAGPDGRVSTPAAADAALAVASVTKQDETSGFSSRGPRAGDYAVKPDIAGPGSDIVAARAAGTPVGDLNPVGAEYARLSGTSMASPHVAGAAAILAQQHPDWNAGRLKPALMSTATPTAAVPDQGAGRVDVARAVTQRTSSTSGSLSYGYFRWPHDPEPVTRTVTYRNDGDAAVTLTLAVVATGPDGRPAPAGMFAASAGQVTVPAGGTTEVIVTAKPAAATIAGLYSGRLTATAAGVTVQTALAAYQEPESYDLTVRLVSRTGLFDGGTAQLVDTATGAVHVLWDFAADGTARVRLPKGRYDLNAFDVSADPDNKDQPYAITLMSRPNLTVGADTSVTLDATAGQPVRAAVDRPDAKRQFGELGLFSAGVAGTAGGSIGWFTRPFYQVFAVPTGRKVTGHPYAFFLRATLAAVRPGTDPAAYVYQLAFLERGHIPSDTVFEAPDRSLAAVRAAYRTQGAASDAIRGDYARLALRGAGSGAFEIYGHTLPGRRTEYYTAHPDVTWLHVLAVSTPESSGSENNFSVRSYRPGRYQAGWNSAPVGPAFGHPADGWGVTRAGSKLRVAVTLLSGSDPAQYAAPASAGMTGTTTLSRDGTVLGTSQQPGIGEFDIPDTAGTYTLRATAARGVAWSVIGSRAEVTWTFREGGASAPVRPLPLVVVRASGEVDDQGRAPAGRPYPLALKVQRQGGTPGAARLTALRVEASYDDGATWTRAPVVRAGDGGVAMLCHPAAGGFVSLRVVARTGDGSAVTQTVIRAYQLAATDG